MTTSTDCPSSIRYQTFYYLVDLFASELILNTLNHPPQRGQLKVRLPSHPLM